MMKVGAMNNPQINIIDELKLFGDFYFDYTDLTIEYPQATTEKIRAIKGEIKDTLSSYNMGLVGHLPWFLNIIHPYDKIKSAVYSEITRIFKICHELEIEHVTVHPDFMKLKRSQKQLASETIDSLRHLIEDASKYNLTLCFENFEEDYFTTSTLKQILSEVDGLKFTLDVGHAYMKTAKTENIIHMLNELKEYLYHVHLHDNKGVQDEHLPLGVGTIDIEKIVAGLISVGYDKTITLEVHAQDREYLKTSKDKLQKLF